MCGVFALVGASARDQLVVMTKKTATLPASTSCSRVSSRSYSASDPRTPIIIRPAAVEESISSSVSDSSDTPRSLSALVLSALTVSNMCNMFRPSRSVDGKQDRPGNMSLTCFCRESNPLQKTS